MTPGSVPREAEDLPVRPVTRVLVLGANGPSGRRTVGQALDRGLRVDALTRRYLADLMPVYAGTVAELAPGTDLAVVVTTLVRQAAELQLAHPGYYRLTEELPPEHGDLPAHQVREQVVDLFAGALRSAGVRLPSSMTVSPAVAMIVYEKPCGSDRMPRGSGTSGP